ncbi:MAG: hypothetical protein BECKG1743F_GA0114225_110854, partial [Candidatus Kentron sp. G]
MTFAYSSMDMPAANATPDEKVIGRADREKRVIVTKDDDFVRSFILLDKPARLWLISTGNIRNDELVQLRLNSDTPMQHSDALDVSLDYKLII